MTKRISVVAPGAKPFLKWAGGKGQLIPVIEAALPELVHTSRNLIYVEPFIGSGAVLFWFLQKFPAVKKAIINDINPDLVTAYRTIKEDPVSLIKCLKGVEEEYSQLVTTGQKRDFFETQRDAFNARDLDAVENTALLIFLNRTCYNGLYRVNGSNRFNVPFGRYNNPRICDTANIMAASELLQKVTILNGDYSATLPEANGDVFYYLDPPYKPISRTASFNAYARDTFDDKEQIRLKAFCDTLTAKNIPWLLSNSDPRNHNPDDHFFDDLYAGNPIQINRVPARRLINSNAVKRGRIMELLISNYPR